MNCPLCFYKQEERRTDSAAERTAGETGGPLSANRTDCQTRCGGRNARQTEPGDRDCARGDGKEDRAVKLPGNPDPGRRGSTQTDRNRHHTAGEAPDRPAGGKGADGKAGDGTVCGAAL